MRVSLLVTFLLAGCAGSPFATSMMSPSQLKSVNDYTLCKAATPRELYSPSYKVMNEVRSRGLSCGSIYTYGQDGPTGSQLLGLANKVYGSNANQAPANRNNDFELLNEKSHSNGFRSCNYKDGNNYYEVISGANDCSTLPASYELISSELKQYNRVCYYRDAKVGVFSVIQDGTAPCHSLQ